MTAYPQRQRIRWPATHSSRPHSHCGLWYGQRRSRRQQRIGGLLRIHHRGPIVGQLPRRLLPLRGGILLAQPPDALVDGGTQRRGRRGCRAMLFKPCASSAMGLPFLKSLDQSFS